MQPPETIDIRVIGPYHGPRISGTSESVDAVSIVRLYHFDGYRVRVTHIPAKRDNATGRLYVTAFVAKQVQRKVHEISESIDCARRETGNAASLAHFNFSISAAEFLPNAA